MPSAPSLIAQLRDVVPRRSLSPETALRVAELQASKLLSALGVTEPPVLEEVVSALPRVQVERLAPIPVSGSTHWGKGTWVIVLNGAEPLMRQRFSLAHEFKHVLDNPFIDCLYPELPGASAHRRAEQVCDYFAACLLMPRPWVKRAYCDLGIQSLDQLSRRFGVSQQAMQVRLLTIGLVDPPARCGRYHRTAAVLPEIAYYARGIPAAA